MFISELTNRELTDKIIDSVLFEGLDDTEEAADCIIVLGSTKASQYKVPVAVSAYKEKRAPKLLLSGGKIKDFNEGRMSEANHMCRTAIMLGVKEEDIVLETLSQNTIENILGALFELQRVFCINHVRRVLLVTTSYHMRRSLSIARYLFPRHIEVLPCPADDTHTRRDNWAYNAEGRKRATDEVRKIIDCVGNGLFPDFEV
jgi:uncharacterized SAM-binding protein YcdF (DUF218 family)